MVRVCDGDRWPVGVVAALVAWLLPVHSALFGQDPQQRAAAEQHFESRIRPVLLENCFPCHGGQKTAGGLHLGSRESLLQGGDSGPAVVPGQPEQSLLWRAIRRESDVLPMPPATADALRADQIADFAQWIAAGAVWPTGTPAFATQQHWAFQPVVPPSLPKINDATWIRTPLDAFILARQETAGLRPLPPADKRTLLRRVTLDLTGLPPTPAEVAAFLNDESPGAFAAVVERLLASPAYGEQWGRHWLDVVRYADTAGETADYPVPTAWRYRNYVIEAFAQDKPYDQFLREQIAGDLLAIRGWQAGDSLEDYAAGVTATGFLAISRRFGFDSENYHHLTIQDSIDTLGQAVLGLSLGCARCHDHKFDPVTMEDYYGLYGIFASTRYAFPGSEQKQRVRALAPLVPPPLAQREWQAYENRLAELAEQLRSQNQAVPRAVLRSLGDLDGDFELQAPAAGGSLGVLVPPWLFAGNIAVTAAAQSPFQHLHPQGQVGVSLAAGNSPYFFRQRLPYRDSTQPAASCFVSCDFRLPADSRPEARAPHRVTLVGEAGQVGVELQISAEQLAVQLGEQSWPLGSLTAKTWYSVQLQIQRDPPQIQGRIATPDAHQVWGPWPLEPSVAQAAWDELLVGAEPAAGQEYAAIEFDNFAVQDTALPPPGTALPASPSAARRTELAAVQSRIRELVGLDGDLELQTEHAPPHEPWNPGPNSVVQIARGSQSPFTDHYPSGELGLHLPRRSEYDGFGLSLDPAELPGDRNVRVAFEFRCDAARQRGDGTWRYYIGQGPGVAATVELFWNGTALYRRSGDVIEQIASLQPGTWYQVQFTIDRAAQRFRGELRSPQESVPLEGAWAAGASGVLDYTFIDSYGNVPGVRPELDADNFVVAAQPNAPVRAAAELSAAAARRDELRQLQAQRSRLQVAADVLRAEILEALNVGPVPLAYAVSEGTPHDVPLQRRGDPTEPGPLVRRRLPQILGGRELPSETRGSGRRELAEWLTNPTQPLTSRVLVNRVWQWHFGAGLVRTPNDFGVRGLPPTHPELLDYLAAEFVRSGWSLKALHRQMLLSATYQQASAETADSTHRELYVGFPRRRLSAEEIRDSLLAVCGSLEPAPAGGHPFPAAAEWGYTQHAPFLELYDHRQRTVYLMTPRLKRHPFLSLFDGPDPNASTPRRLTTTVPTQALFFLNDPLLHEQSAVWARQLQAAEPTADGQIKLAYAAALQRAPAAGELARAQRFEQEYVAAQRAAGQAGDPTAALAAYLRSLLASNEFLYID